MEKPENALSDKNKQARTKIVKKVIPVFYDKETLRLYKRFRRSVGRGLAYLESRASYKPQLLAASKKFINDLVVKLEAELKIAQKLQQSMQQNSIDQGISANAHIEWGSGIILDEITLVYFTQARFLYVLELTDRLFALEHYFALMGVDFTVSGGLWRRKHHNRIVNLSAQILHLTHEARLPTEKSSSAS